MNELIESGLKFDAIITDPPYGTTACKWDTIIPFDKMWECLNNLKKENAPIILFGSEPFSSLLRCSNLKEYKYDWVWQKSHAANFMVAKKKPLIKHENILVFYDKNKIYNPQMVKGNPHMNRSGTKISDRNKDSIYGSKPDILANVMVEESYPSSVLPFSGGAMCKRVHPTQKPVELLEYLIKTYTNEENIILDFTCGSGTTLVAAKNLNRKCYGIELEIKYCEITKNRLVG